MILFRGERVDNGEWAEGDLLNDKGKSYIVCESETSCIDGENTDLYATEWYEVNPSTICQYTGLIDKNGREIFEGDIVEIPPDDERYVIAWDIDTARFAIVQCGSVMYDFDNYWGYELEIIGNIFDNPELIGE